MSSQPVYDESSIKVLKGLEAVRNTASGAFVYAGELPLITWPSLWILPISYAVMALALCVHLVAALRGTLFDVADAQSAYLSAAIAYIEGLTQLDASRYVLLARTGRLLEQFDMEGQP